MWWICCSIFLDWPRSLSMSRRTQCVQHMSTTLFPSCTSVHCGWTPVALHKNWRNEKYTLVYRIVHCMLLSQVWHGMVGLVGGAVTPVPSPNEAKQGLGRPRPCKEALQPFFNLLWLLIKENYCHCLSMIWTTPAHILPVSPIYIMMQGKGAQKNPTKPPFDTILFLRLYSATFTFHCLRIYFVLLALPVATPATRKHGGQNSFHLPAPGFHILVTLAWSRTCQQRHIEKQCRTILRQSSW